MNQKSIEQRLEVTKTQIERLKNEIQRIVETTGAIDTEVGRATISQLDSRLQGLKGQEFVYEDFLKEYEKEGQLVDTPGGLLLRIPKQGISHMLKDRDQKPVDIILKYLRSNEITPYISGGTLMRHFQSGKKDYTDIDITGITKGPNSLVVTNLTHSGNPLEVMTLEGYKGDKKTGEETKINPVNPLYSSNGRKIILEGIEFEVYNRLNIQVQYNKMSYPALINPNKEGVLGMFSIIPRLDFETKGSAIELLIMTEKEADKQYRR